MRGFVAEVVGAVEATEVGDLQSGVEVVYSGERRFYDVMSGFHKYSDCDVGLQVFLQGNVQCCEFCHYFPGGIIFV